MAESKAAVELRSGRKARFEVADSVSDFDIYGGRNLAHHLASARKFVLRRSLPIRTHEFPELKPTLLEGTPVVDVSRSKGDSSDGNVGDLEPSFQDTNIRVWAMPVLPNVTRKRSRDEFETGHQASLTASSLEEDREVKQQIRKDVVSEMFNSVWRLDTLVEKQLSEIESRSTQIFIRNPKTGRIELYCGPRPQPSGPDNRPTLAPELDRPVLVRNQCSDPVPQRIPATCPAPEAMSYIVKCQDQRGTFLPREAMRLGVKAGPDFAVLTRGGSVQAADGSLVTSKMVLTETKPGEGLAVIDLPTVEYVENMVQRWEWKSKELMQGVGAIFWILGPGVGEDEGLRSFIKQMSHLEHVVSSPDHCPDYLALDSGAAASLRHHLIDPSRFAVPTHDNVRLPQTRLPSTSTIQRLTSADSLELIPAQRGHVIQLAPRVEVQNHDIVPLLDTGKVIRDCPPEVLQKAREVAELLRTPERVAALDEQSKGLPGADAEIITLGTGSAMPSKYRNVSATLVRVPGEGSWLFDCGEGTLGQMKRVFGAEELTHVLRDLRGIWISHMHADHHLGTVGVIRAWHEAMWHAKEANSTRSENGAPSEHSPIGDSPHKRRLFVISGPLIHHFLSDYASMEAYGYDQVLPVIVRQDTGFETSGDQGGSPTILAWAQHRNDDEKFGNRTNATEGLQR